MLRAMNFVLNQLGFVVVVAAALLLYYDRIVPSWEFFTILALLLLATLTASESIYRSIKKRSRRIS